MPRTEQPAIGSYALIGDTRSAALCSAEGAIDWLCIPRFDSEPVFSRLVAGERGGSFSVRPRNGRPAGRGYLPGSAVLETSWRADGSELSVTDGMVVDVEGALLPRLVLVRRLEARGAPIEVDIVFDPRRGLPGRAPDRVARRGTTVVSSWGSLAVAITTDADARLQPGTAEHVTVDPSRPVTLAMTVAHREPLVLVEPEAAYRMLRRTDEAWRNWSQRLDYGGLRPSTVERSLVTLRLLTYSPSGAAVAAPTTSLPEAIGAGRNWDYRYSWPRDSSLGIEAFLGVGRSEEPQTYLHWLLHASRITRPRVRVLYSLDGRPGSEEVEADVPGYRGSRPVRLGNGASDQHQLDVYGWGLRAAATMEARGERLDGETWRAMADLADFVASRWRDPDAGIWERRGSPAHHVHSKLMAWLALDRALRIASSRRVRRRRVSRWSEAREAITAEVRRKGWDDDAGAYVAAFGDRSLDAAVLVPLVEWEDRGSPRFASTVDAIASRLSAGRPLLYRYAPET
ncbi:MAG TPA: glycoside hydrolase family 15 protein, partial [Actinomycetota bacterium]|nr:glycoside hydrolase family 15 protein [Actinomycetota bacterium]